MTNIFSLNWVLGNRKLSMAATLAIAFGGMMALALGIVIFGTYKTAGRTTGSLAVDNVNLILDRVNREVDVFLKPAERALIFTASLLENSGGNRAALESSVTGLLAATPQLGGLAIVDLDGTVEFLGPPPDGSPKIIQIDPNDSDGFRVTESTGVAWSAPFWSETSQSTVINAQLRLPDDGGNLRLLVTGVFLPTFTELLNRVSRDIDQDVFVLHGRDRVIGYSGLDLSEFSLNEEAPLPSIREISDPVIAQIWENSEYADVINTERLRGRGRLIVEDDVAYALVYRQINDYAELPWLIGVKINLETNNDPFEELAKSAGIAVAISAVAILITLRLGRRMAKPIERLAKRAGALQALESEPGDPLPPSRIAELDKAASAFNAMGSALVWFNTYLPKRLVTQLISKGSPDAIMSEEREVTVMFTDIVAFSSRTSVMTPSEVAGFLNRHFDRLETCISAEAGLIDKYIGDSVMAFWGAPQEQPDHAARAVAAAYRIRESLKDEDIALRIGIHTGKVLVGNIGAAVRLNYTVVGESVNIAQRLEQFGKTINSVDQVTILASHSTVTQAGAEGKACGTPVLRGQNTPINLVQL